MTDLHALIVSSVIVVGTTLYWFRLARRIERTSMERLHQMFDIVIVLIKLHNEHQRNLIDDLKRRIDDDAEEGNWWKK